MDIIEFLTICILILLFAKVFGNLAITLGQPAVLGELLAGIILGPFALNLLSDPKLFYHNSMFYLLAEVGLLLLLFEIGLETSLSDLLKVGKKSAAVGAAGVVLPFILAYLFCTLIGEPTLENVLIASALTATSIGITSKVFSELGFLGTKESQIVIGAAIIDDILALAILSIVSSISTAGESITFMLIAKTIIIALSFLVIAILIGKLIICRFISILEKMKVRSNITSGAILFALVFALLAIKAGSSIVIGAFAAGILFSETRTRKIIEKEIKPIVDIFTPIFFVSVGIAFDIRVFNVFNPENWTILLWIIGLLFIAIVSKFIVGFIIPKEKDLDRRIIGVSMIPRGEVGLVFASMGKISGVLTTNMYTVIVATVILSTIIVPPILKYLIAQKKTSTLIDSEAV